MSLKSKLQPFAAAAITTPLRRDALRRLRERWRRLRGEAHRLTAYVRLDDPYALVLLHGLQTVRERFDIELDVRVVGSFRLGENQRHALSVRHCCCSSQRSSTARAVHPHH